MSRRRVLPIPFLTLLLLWPAAGLAADRVIERGEALPQHRAGDPSSAVVTEANLMESERFWPYRAALVEAWTPEGAMTPIEPGVAGVLIRVEAGGTARIDFGRNGLAEAVPVGVTDLVARANEVRLGTLAKMGPNYIVNIGPRLADSESDPAGAYPLSKVIGRTGFLAVFADPTSQDFPALAASLAALRERHDVLTILLPQGPHDDAALRNRLRELDWPVPYVWSYLTAPYSRTLLPEGSALPHLQLVTVEGRVVFEETWKPTATPRLTQALDAAFGSVETASGG